MGKIKPINSIGAPTPDKRESVRKKHPIGTPALPMAEITEMRIQRQIVAKDIGVLPCCMTNKEVTRIKAAQPFMLIVVQIGRTKREICFCTPSLFSAVSIVTGSVAAELFVNKAIKTAGIIRERVRIG